MLHRGRLHVCDAQRPHDTIFSMFVWLFCPDSSFKFSGLWQITHKSNKLLRWEILRCLVDVDVAIAVAVDGDSDDAGSESVVVCSGFVRSGNVLSVGLRLSVIFLLKQEKQDVDTQLFYKEIIKP